MLSPQEKNFAKLLIENNIISHEQLQTCIKLIHSNGAFGFTHALLKQKFITPEVLSRFQNTSEVTKVLNAPTGEISVTKPFAMQSPRQNEFLHYKIERELGRGGMGVVYKAIDTKLKRHVAIKVILAEKNLQQEHIKRFMREAKAMAKVRHPHIIEIYDVAEHPRPYLVMEYIEGRDLANLADSTRLSYQDIARILKCCAEALYVAHKSKIIHRDIKPANILIDASEQPKIMDFGLAKEMDEGDTQLSQAGMVIGTLAYMPPEQAAGETISPSADIYSLGASLYHLLTDRPPFKGSSIQIMHQIFEEEPVPPRVLNPETPIDLEAICLKCMEKKPRKRYTTAQGLAKDLAAFLENRPVVARPITKWRKMTKWMARNKLITTISLGSLILYIVGTLIALFFISQEKEKALEIALKERNANAKLEKMTQKASEAEKDALQKALEAKQNAQEAKQNEAIANREKIKAQVAGYYSNIVLANKYYEDYQSDNAEYYLNQCSDNLKGWEWYWLKSRRGQHQAINKYSTVDYLKLSNNRNYFTALVKDKEIYQVIVWNIKKNELISKLEISSDSQHCCFTPDDTCVVYGQGQTIYFWDFRENKINAEFKHNLSEGRVCHFSFDKGGKKLIAAYEIPDFDNWTGIAIKEKDRINLVVWDVQKQQKLMSFKSDKAFENNMNSCIFSEDGTKIISAGQYRNRSQEKNTSIEVWDIATQQLEGPIVVHSRDVNCLVLKSNGKSLITGSDDATVAICDLANNTTHVLKGHNRPLSDCSVSPDEKWIASASLDGTVRVWRQQKDEFSIYCVFVGHQKSVKSCEFLTNEIIISSDSSGNILRWNIHEIAHKNSKILSGTTGALQARFSSDSKEIMVVYRDQLAPFLYNIDSLEKQNKVFLKHLGKVHSCAFSPDGKTLAITPSDGEPTLWNFETTQVIRRLIGHKKNTFVVDFEYSPSGKKVASAGQDFTVCVWDISNVPLVASMQDLYKTVSLPHGKRVHSIDFIDDNKLISVTTDGHLRLWDINFPQNPIKRTQVPGKLFSCAYNPISKKIVTAGERENNLIVWDSTTWKPVQYLRGHTGQVLSCNFNKDGTRVISAGQDGTLKLWKIDNNEEHLQPLLILDERNFAINYCEFSPDDQKIVACGDDFLIKIWEIIR